MKPISRRLFTGGALASGAASLLPSRARAAGLPAGQLRMICPWSAGGTADTYLRGFATIAENYLDRRIIVENRPGSGGTVGLAFTARQKPDGSVIAGVTDAAYQYTLTQKVPFDTVNDFTFLGGGCVMTNGYVVKADSPFRDFASMVAAAKERPGKVRIAAGGSPANPPLVFLELEHATKQKFLLLSYAGGGEYINAVMSGEADVVGDAIGPSAGMIEAGTMRLLAVAAPERIKRYPDVPTARELGYDIQVQFTVGFVGPQGMPKDIARIYSDAIEKVTADPAHDVLLHRMTLERWSRSGEGYETFVRELYKNLPDKMRALGMLKS